MTKVLTPEELLEAERRRTLRVDGVFRVRIKGQDELPVARPGNISPTGIYFETQHSPGNPGTVHTLDVASEDGSLRVVVLAVVVRVSTVLDLWSGSRVTGAAFQFMPTQEQTRHDVEAILDHTLQRVGQGGVPNIVTMTLVSSHALAVGSIVEAELRSSTWQGAAHVHATVTSSQRLLEGPPARFHVSLTTEAQPEQPKPPEGAFEAGSSISDALASFVEKEQAAPEPRPLNLERAHLGGLLSQVRLQSILGFFAMERMNGVLTLKRDGVLARIHLRDGALVDAESPDFPYDARTLLVDLIQWTDGEFEVALQSVDRPDKLGMPTMALLLDISREMDERSGITEEDEFADFLK